MLARCSSRRIPQSLYLDFLAPTLLHSRNQSTASTRSSQPKHPKKRAPKTSQSNDPSRLTAQITKTVSLLARHDGVIPPNREIELFETVVSRIRNSFFKHDIPAVWKSWSVLVEKNMLQFLGLPQLEAYSRQIAGMYETHPSGEEWKTSDREAMHEIALFSAAGGRPEALNTILAFMINHDNADGVLDLYRKFLSKPSDSKPVEEGDHLEGEIEDATTLEPPLQSSSGRADVMLYAITACAIKDSFHEAVRMVINTNTRLSPLAISRLIPSHPIRPKVSKYVERLSVARLLGHPPLFAKHLANLTRDRNESSLEKLYRIILDGILGQEPWVAAAAEKAGDLPVTLPDFTWTSMITSFMTCKRPDLAEKLWDDMIKCGVNPQVATWTAIFDGYNILGAYKESFSTWDAMISQGIKPEPLTYRAIIATLFNCRRPKDAMEKYLEYERNWSPNKKSLLSQENIDSQVLALHNTVLHGLFTNTDKEHEALVFFKRMQTRGPKPDVVSWNTLMGYYSRRGNLKMLSSALQSMRDGGLTGDVFTYSIILSALLKAGREDAPDLIIGMMKKHGIERNATVNTAIIGQILQTPDPARLKAAFAILTRMESEESIQAQPNEITYTTILAALYRGNWERKDEIDVYRQDILRRMQARDIKPNRTTHHILIRACFDGLDREGFRYAIEHYESMMRQKIAPTFDTWWILLDGLLRKNQIQLANDMVDEMVHNWAQPTGSLISLVDRIRKHRDRR